jgi:hypothetical protein
LITANPNSSLCNSEIAAAHQRMPFQLCLFYLTFLGIADGGFQQSDDIKNSPKRAKLEVKVGRRYRPPA